MFFFFCLFAFFIDRYKFGALKKLREIFRNLFLILLISRRTKNKLNSTLNGEERKTVSIMSSSASFHVSKFSFFTHVWCQANYNNYNKTEPVITAKEVKDIGNFSRTFLLTGIFSSFRFTTKPLKKNSQIILDQPKCYNRLWKNHSHKCTTS